MWPKQPEDICNLPDDQPELKKSNVCAAANTVNLPTDVELSDIFDRFSSWIRLKKTIAWVLCYITNLRNSVLKCKSGDESNGRQEANVIAPITTKEMMTAEHEILKYVQAESFNDELDNLHQPERQPSKTSSIRKKSSLYQLDPTLEDSLL